MSICTDRNMFGQMPITNTYGSPKEKKYMFEVLRDLTQPQGQGN